jgi:hypothetical protein
LGREASGTDVEDCVGLPCAGDSSLLLIYFPWYQRGN